MPVKDLSPQEDKRWRSAILQVVTNAPEAQEFSTELWREHQVAEAALMSLMPETERIAFLESRLENATRLLTDWGVPGWAIELRKHCIVKGWEANEAWLPPFTLRSAAALMGLQLRYPTQDTRTNAYRRLLLNFFHKALEPFVEWAEDKNSSLRRDYGELVDLYDFIEELDCLPGPEEWQSKQRTLTHRNPRIITSETGQTRDGSVLCARLVRIAEIVLFENPDTWWSTTGTDLAEVFFEIHRWPRRLETRHIPTSITSQPSLHHIKHLSIQQLIEEYRKELINAEPVAMAYQIALEAECPAPDWLSL